MDRKTKRRKVRWKKGKKTKRREQEIERDTHCLWFLVSFRLGGSPRLDCLPTCNDSRPARVVYVRPRLLSRRVNACNDSKFRSPPDSIKRRPRIDRLRGVKRSGGAVRNATNSKRATRRAQAGSASDRLFPIYEHMWREGVCRCDVKPSVHRVPHVVTSM